jgi:hypothetical protein
MRILQKLLRLAGVELTLQKGRRPSADKSVFKQLRDRLSEDQQLTDQRIPFVGNAYAKFSGEGCQAVLDAPHMSFEMTMTVWLPGDSGLITTF